MPRGEVVLKRVGRADDARPALSLHVPSALVVAADLEPGMRFRPELTDDGILYRPVDVPPMNDPRPAWRRS